MRKRNKQKLTVILLALLLVLSICAGALFYVMMKRETEAFSEYKESAEKQLEELDSALRGEKNRLQQLEEERGQLYAAKVELQGQYDALSSTALDSDAKYEQLNAELSALNGELDLRDAEISELKENIKKLESVYSVDINKQFDIISELNALLENVPQLEVVTEVKKEDGTVEKKVETRTPKISIYYEDINKGYKFSYLADDVYYTASLLKAPFVLSVLQSAEAELVARAEKLADDPNAVLPVPKYDFTKKFTYTADKFQSGSGKIKDEGEGKEYTYLELIQYLLMYSDNVAYEALKNEYGIDGFRKLAVSLGTSAMRKSLSDITAADGGKVMKAIYEYIESDGAYSSFMYDCMTQSAHTVMISYAVYPKKVAHKYGWDTDTYHDMAIVYDDNPYVLVVLSDMEEGGDVVNKYIQSVVKLVAKLHANFYAKAK